jgi:hypothetical protein
VCRRCTTRYQNVRRVWVRALRRERQGSALAAAVVTGAVLVLAAAPVDGKTAAPPHPTPSSLLKVPGLPRQRFKAIPRHVLRVVEVNGTNALALQPIIDGS